MHLHPKLSVILLSFVAACGGIPLVKSTGSGQTSQGEPITAQITRQSLPEISGDGYPPGEVHKLNILFYNARGVKCVASSGILYFPQAILPITCDDGNSGSLEIWEELREGRTFTYGKIDYKLMDGERGIITYTMPRSI